MRIEEHEAESIMLFGKPYSDVHIWLDEFAWTSKGFDMHHRKHRHHQNGIKEAGRLFGDIGAKVAERHILSDLEQDILFYEIPKDYDDYVRKGLL